MALCGRCHREAAPGALFCAFCGTAIVPEQAAGAPPDPYIGQTIRGVYFVQQRIGAGGMGVVYKATHVTLDVPVALKILKKALLADASVVQRFHREARAASRLRHPNVIGVTDFGQTDDGALFMAMEHVAGKSLARAIAEESPLSEARVVRIGSQILSALEEAHANQILHRDLKPENVMLESRREEPDLVKVLDFGIAKIQMPGEGQSTLTQAGLVCGTPGYMSPEQWSGEQLDARSDLYAVGVILYEMLTGKTPFDVTTPMELLRKHLTERPVAPSLRRPDRPMSLDLELLVMRALSVNREERPSSAAEMRGALLACELLPEAAEEAPAGPPKTVFLETPASPPGASARSTPAGGAPGPGEGALRRAPGGTPTTRTPAPRGSTPGATPRPRPPTAGATPRPHTPGATPRPYAPGATPRPHAPGATPRPHAPGATPRPRRPTPAPAAADEAAPAPPAEEGPGGGLAARLPAWARGRTRVLAGGAAGLAILAVAIGLALRAGCGGAPAALPAIASATPSSGSTAGGATVVIRGSGFQPGATVRFGGKPATVASSIETALEVTTPAHDAGRVDVVVANPGGRTATLAGGYAFAAPPPLPPAVTRLVPSSGPAWGGTDVVLEGSGFAPGVAVSFGGAPATVVASSPTAVRVKTPEHAIGNVDVVVSNPDRQSWSVAGAYGYWVVPPGARRSPVAVSETLNGIPTPPAASGQGVISVQAEPFGEVFLDGRRYGVTPREFRLPAGSYGVRVSHPKLGKRERRLEVRAGERVRWVADFHR
jgi:serine/threonine-protein kinase